MAVYSAYSADSETRCVSLSEAETTEFRYIRWMIQNVNQGTPLFYKDLANLDLV